MNEDHNDASRPLLHSAPPHPCCRLQRGDGLNDDCPITGLVHSGYVGGWRGRYLTSNIVDAKTGLPVGSRYANLTGDFGTKLLVFGFLYDMPDHCPAVQVQKVETVVASRWFRAALAGPGAVADAVVVLAHMDADDPVSPPILLRPSSHIIDGSSMRMDDPDSLTTELMR